ncbi:MAG: CHASE3 domain-containing protein [Sphingobacteriaceae bacterium]|nr:CHASE3 domain-containing protein [Sphingobacteriaceae bacterium]
MKLATQIFLGFSVVIGISLTDSYVNYNLSQKVNRNTDYVAKSETIIRNSSRLHKSIIEMQSAFRGFLLTDDKAFLDSYHEGGRVIPKLFIEQRSLLLNSASQAAKLDTITKLHQEWIIYSNKLIEAKKSVKINPSLYVDLFENKLRKQVGKKINDRISLIFRAFDRAEYRLRESRRDALNHSVERTRTYSVIFLALTVFIGVLSTVYIVRLITRRIALMVNLADNISKGEFAVVKDDKNDELTSLSVSLNSMSETLDKNIKELEKRNKELNQFAYVVSHDLKAPIRGIYNVTQWIEEDLGNEVSPQMRNYLNIIPDRIKRMEDLIHGLLDYARISREKPLREKVDVNTLVKDIAELIIPEDFKIQTFGLPVLITEKIRLEQVFSNLISNAVKYSKSDVAGEIVIRCREVNQFYEFSIRDNGIGIEPQFHSKIFEIFQTLREKNAKESTGIGLAIVKKIIDDQHCTIGVESELGKGSTFVFTWPKH